MKKKIILFSGILLMIIIVVSSFPVSSQDLEKGIFNRNHLRAIGNNFHICEDDGGLYGHILIGINGFEFVLNEDIIIPKDNIRWIIMTKHILNCVYID